MSPTAALFPLKLFRAHAMGQAPAELRDNSSYSSYHGIEVDSAAALFEWSIFS